MDKNMDRPIEDMRLAQIGFLVNDIEKTKKEFARFFGVEEPETVNSGEYEITHTEYRGCLLYTSSQPPQLRSVFSSLPFSCFFLLNFVSVLLFLKMLTLPFISCLYTSKLLCILQVFFNKK